MATYYFRGPTSPGTAATSASNVAANWSTTDNGTNDGIVPTATDIAKFTANSGNCVLTGTTSWNNIDFTGYNGTFSGSASLNMAGAAPYIIFSPTMTIAVTGTLTNTGTNLTATFNGKKWTGTILLSTASNLILNDDGIVQHFISGGSGTKALNGSGKTMYVDGNLTMTDDMSGTATLYMQTQTTGSITGAGNLRSPFIVNPIGTLTCAGALSMSNNKITILNTNGGTFNCTAISHNYGTTSGTLTIESYAGFAISGTLSMGGNMAHIIQLNNDIRCLTFAVSGGVNGKILNGATLYCTNINISATIAGVSGTATIVMDGSGVGNNGTLTLNGTNLWLNNITIDTAGGITLAGSISISGGKTLWIKRASSVTVNAGVGFTFGSGNLVFKDTVQSLQFAAIVFNGNGGTTSNWDGDLYGTTFTISNGTTNTYNGGNIYCSGNFTTSAIGLGNYNLYLNGSGTINGINVQNENIIVDTTGTYTLLSNITPQGLFKVKTGATIISTGFSLILGNGSQIDTSPITWETVSHPTSTSSTTLLSTLNTTNWVIANNNVTLLGNFAIVADQAIWTTTNGTPIITLSSGEPYIIKYNFTSNQTYAKARTIQSAIPGTKVRLTLNHGATCNVGYWNFIDIDASGGRSIVTFAGVVTNCNNVVIVTEVNKTIARSFAA